MFFFVKLSAKLSAKSQTSHNSHNFAQLAQIWGQKKL